MKKILIADDDMQIVDSIKKMLSPFYEVDVAVTAVETLSLCEKNHYDGLIIDVDFGPGINGLETASILRSENQEIAIIVFSAMDYSNTVREKALELGASFFEKPLKLDLINSIFGVSYGK